MNEVPDPIYLTGQAVLNREKEDWIFLHNTLGDRQDKSLNSIQK